MGKKKPTASQQARKKNEANYKSFVTRSLKKDPTLGAKELVRQWRGKGKQIGNVVGQEIVRTKKGIEKNVAKQAAAKAPRIRMYGLGTNPRNVNRIVKGRYQYTVQFEVVREGFVSSDTELVIIPSSRKLSTTEIEDAVLAYVEDMSKNKVEKYKAIGVVDGSIVVLFGIDKNKK